MITIIIIMIIVMIITTIVIIIYIYVFIHTNTNGMFHVIWPTRCYDSSGNGGFTQKKKKSQQWRNGTAYFWTNLHREYDEYVQTGSENKKQRHAKFLTPQGMWGSKNTCGILLIQPHCKWLWSWDRRESISVACCFCPFNVHPPVWTYTWEKNTT